MGEIQARKQARENEKAAREVGLRTKAPGTDAIPIEKEKVQVEEPAAKKAGPSKKSGTRARAHRPASNEASTDHPEVLKVTCTDDRSPPHADVTMMEAVTTRPQEKEKNAQIHASHPVQVTTPRVKTNAAGSSNPAQNVHGSSQIPPSTRCLWKSPNFTPPSTLDGYNAMTDEMAWVHSLTDLDLENRDHPQCLLGRGAIAWLQYSGLLEAQCKVVICVAVGRVGMDLVGVGNTLIAIRRRKERLRRKGLVISKRS